MAPKRYLNPVLVERLYYRYRSYRRVAEELESLGIVNPNTDNPYSHMAVAKSYRAWVYGTLKCTDEEIEEWKREAEHYLED